MFIKTRRLSSRRGVLYFIKARRLEFYQHEAPWILPTRGVLSVCYEHCVSELSSSAVDTWDAVCLSKGQASCLYYPHVV